MARVRQRPGLETRGCNGTRSAIADYAERPARMGRQSCGRRWPGGWNRGNNGPKSAFADCARNLGACGW